MLSCPWYTDGTRRFQFLFSLGLNVDLPSPSPPRFNGPCPSSPDAAIPNAPTVGTSITATFKLARRVDGIFLSDFEQGEIGPDLFRHACLMGLEGLVSKHKDRPYRAGRSPYWVKVKNREHPAMSRVMDAFS